MEQFADEICMLFENEQRRRQFESAASVFAAAEFSRDKAYRAFLELLGSRVTTDQRVRLAEESGG
jgi:hypothetical protein